MTARLLDKSRGRELLHSKITFHEMSVSILFTGGACSHTLLGRNLETYLYHITAVISLVTLDWSM